jgi:ATP-dependent DNA ligase
MCPLGNPGGVLAMGFYRFSHLSEALLACTLDSCEGIVSKQLGPRYRSGRSRDWLKFKNPEAPAVRREAEEEGKER